MSATVPVLLLHGLYFTPQMMRPLGRRLAAQGFTVHYFGYRSVRQSLAQHAACLAHVVADLQAAHAVPIHLIGHSLGGLVVRQFAAMHPHGSLGRCVTLGTPHQGSAVAKHLRQHAPYLLGASYTQALDGELPLWPGHCQWGSIAGNVNIGVGRLLGVSGLDAGDGTVSITETQLPGGHHLVLPVSHTAMLFDAEVARQSAYFLCHGCFEPRQSNSEAV